MKIHAVLLLTAALGLSAPAVAHNATFDDVVAQSGLSKQQVRMLIGARTAYPAYRTSYERLRRRLIAAVGQEGYQELVKEIELQRPGPASSSAG